MSLGKSQFCLHLRPFSGDKPQKESAVCSLGTRIFYLYFGLRWTLGGPPKSLPLILLLGDLEFGLETLMTPSFMKLGNAQSGGDIGLSLPSRLAATLWTCKSDTGVDPLCVQVKSVQAGSRSSIPDDISSEIQCSPVDASILHSSYWTVVWSAPWKFRANFLGTEARALVWSVEHLLRANRKIGKHVICLVDNLPVALAATRGRGKSSLLKFPLRHIASPLTSGSRLHVRWIPSELKFALFCHCCFFVHFLTHPLGQLWTDHRPHSGPMKAASPASSFAASLLWCFSSILWIARATNSAEARLVVSSWSYVAMTCNTRHHLLTTLWAEIGKQCAMTGGAPQLTYEWLWWHVSPFEVLT